MAKKKKNHSTLAHKNPITTAPLPVLALNEPLPTQRRTSQRKSSKPKPELVPSNPNDNPDIIDGSQALRASPDMDIPDGRLRAVNLGFDGSQQTEQEEHTVTLTTREKSDSLLSDLSSIRSSVPPSVSKRKSEKKLLEPKDRSGVDQLGAKNGISVVKSHKQTTKDTQFLDPEAEEVEGADEEEIQAALSRPPPVNSDYLPLPWRGRLGYVRRNLPT